MIKSCLTKLCGKSNTGFGCKILGCDTDSEPCSSHKDQNKEILNNEAMIIAGNTNINDPGNNYRNKKIEHNFKKFEERCKNALFFVVFQIDCERTHVDSFLHFILIYTKYCLRIDKVYYIPVQ